MYRMGGAPLRWQFKDETIGIIATRGQQLNCFGLLSRKNEFIFKTTTKNINTDFVIEFLEQVSFSITKPTVIILDNVRIHTAHKIKAAAARNELNFGKHVDFISFIYLRTLHI